MERHDSCMLRTWTKAKTAESQPGTLASGPGRAGTSPTNKIYYSCAKIGLNCPKNHGYVYQDHNKIVHNFGYHVPMSTFYQTASLKMILTSPCPWARLSSLLSMKRLEVGCPSVRGLELMACATYRFATFRTRGSLSCSTTLGGKGHKYRCVC